MTYKFYKAERFPHWFDITELPGSLPRWNSTGSAHLKASQVQPLSRREGQLDPHPMDTKPLGFSVLGVSPTLPNSKQSQWSNGAEKLQILFQGLRNRTCQLGNTCLASNGWALNQQAKLP